MHWIFLCLIVAFLYSIVAFFDNYITDVIFKGKRPQAIKAFNVAFYLIVALLIVLIFGIESIPAKIALLALGSGIIHSLASIPYYQALREEEATAAAIYFQLIPVICIFADIYLMHRQITSKQILAFIIILLAPVAILFSQRTRNKKISKKKLRSDILLIVYVILSSISTIIFSHISQDSLDPWTLFFWYIVGRFTFDTSVTIFRPSMRKYAYGIFKKNPIKTVAVIYGAGFIYIIGDFIYRYALSLTNSSFVTAISNASELIMTFVMGIILSIIWPKIGREKIDKRTVGAHLVAVILVITSIILIQ